MKYKILYIWSSGGQTGISILSFDMRAGPVISLMDLDEEWYYRTFLDVGENGFGLSALPLRDCPENAVFMDVCMLLHKMGGRSKCPTLSASLSDNAGDMMWRHTENQIPNKLVGDLLKV